MGLRSMHEEEQSKTIAELSLENSELKKELRSKSEMIKSLNARIGTLYESDLELRKSEQKLLESQRCMKEAEALKDKASRDLAEANNKTYYAEKKSNELQKIINEGIKKEAQRIEREKAQAVKRENLNHFVQVGSLTVALSLYCFIMTAIWLVDRWQIVKTVPQWFLNRWGNLQTIWGGVVSVHSWAYKLLQPHMSDFIAKAIPFAVLLAIVALIGYFCVWNGFWFLLKEWSNLWEHYKSQEKKLLKVSTTIAIITVSAPLSVFVVGIGSLNVFSWWLIFSIVLNVAYHAITYKL